MTRLLMIKSLIISISFFLLLSQLKGQKSSPGIKNLNMEIRNNQVILNYDLMPSRDLKEYRIDLRFLTSNYSIIHPYSITGDMGEGIESGAGREIIWDITRDIKSLDHKITPIIYVNADQGIDMIKGGPNCALLSVLVPGLGDYFVADSKEMVFKPYMRTITSLGLIGLGIYAGSQRKPGPGEYKTYHTYKVIYLPPNYYPTYVPGYKETYVPGEIESWLFNGDKEVFIAAGVAVWIMDIAWVLGKGTINEKMEKSLDQDLTLGQIPGGVEMKYTRRF